MEIYPKKKNQKGNYPTFHLSKKNLPEICPKRNLCKMKFNQNLSNGNLPDCLFV